MNALGFDTSNYTTSVAYFGKDKFVNCSQLLPVREGELGLRQSDAVFHHIKSLPELSGRLFSDLSSSEVAVVGVSTRPRAVEGSYMPCFLVGQSHAETIAQLLHIPLFKCSHQQGHVAAALWSSGHIELIDHPHLAWHLSGGTTEFLLIEPEGRNVRCTKIGGTTDISAGQLIDRAGQMLKLSFPSGKHLDAISGSARLDETFCAKCRDLYFSLSGIQNKVEAFYTAHPEPSEVAAYVLRCVCAAVLKTTENALKAYPGLPVVFSGGVSSNSMLRQKLSVLNGIFAAPEFSRDNAMGVAILASRSLEG